MMDGEGKAAREGAGKRLSCIVAGLLIKDLCHKVR